MPSQQAEVLETIAALKRKLKREQDSATGEPISSATNRGNKLKRGANKVHAGALPYPHGPHGYKEQIEHAGYTRYILARNPKRFNEYGYELDDSESDAEADVDAEEENAYSGVRIEELLRPLTHPSELATHPTLSIPFLDPALPSMAESLEEKLRQERATLWKAKLLHRQLIGDENWMPCGAVETSEDWNLFDPKIGGGEDQSRKRKRDEPLHPIENGIQHRDHFPEANGQMPTAAQKEALPVTTSDDSVDKEPLTANQAIVADTQKPAGQDIDMQDEEPTTNGIHIKKDPNDEEAVPDGPAPEINGDVAPSLEDAGGDDPDNPVDASDSGTGSPAPPTRRITRALAAENTSTAPTPPLSPSPSESTLSSSLLTADPLFLLPPQLSTIHRLPAILQALQLPVEELLDTRRLLFMYIQKQEESVRGLEAVLGKLIKANRMKDQLWEMCRAEGHVGEWSDGEDWIDAEAWGEREEDLKKGKDEEDVPQEEEGRKGKRRARARDRDRDRDRVERE